MSAVTPSARPRAAPTIDGMPRYAQAERQALADFLLSVGPEAPTLNEGWSTRDLAAHLLIRDRRPDAAAGILLRPLQGYGERVRRAVAARPFSHLVDQLRRAPWWSPVSNPLVDEAANTMEFFIHHEDVRRAQQGWQPRQLPASQQAALWRRIPALARRALRGFPGTLLIQSPGYGETSTGAGGEPLRLIGSPGELGLFLFGRQRVARIQLDGPPVRADRLRAAKLGI
jgi:uncharacterized protein (TIGR03085 family)